MMASCHWKGENSEADNHVNTVDHTDTLMSVTQQINEDSLNPELYRRRAKYFLSKRMFSEALGDTRRALAIDEKDVKNHITLGEIFMQMGQAERAREIYSQTISIDPENPLVYVNMARFHLILGNIAPAFNYLDQALILDPINSEALFLKGYAYMENADTTKAIDYYMQSVSVDQNNIDAILELASIYTIRDKEMALQYFGHANTILPDDLDILYMIGVLKMETGRPVEAESIYNEIISFDSSYVNAYYNLGYLYLMFFEKYRKGIDYFTKSLEIEPEYLDAIYNIGLSYEILEESDTAREYYKRVLKINPNYERAIVALNRLDDL